MLCLLLTSVIMVEGIHRLKLRENDFKYFNETRERDNVAGIYWRNDYYCVWVKDKTEEQIEDIDAHEQCHHFVYLDKKHFC